MSKEGRWAMSQWMMAFAELPKDHPDYEQHEIAKALVLAAGAGGFVCGIVVGFIIGLLVL